VPVEHGPRLRVSRSVRVRLLDISADGALLAAAEALPVKTTGHLRVMLGSRMFEADVRVRRVATGLETLHGVTIVPVAHQDREALDQFLRRAGG
jgi:hypothetical protein